MSEPNHAPIDVSADDVAGMVEARRVLGSDGEQAVIMAFLERTGHAIDARVDARIAQNGAHARPASKAPSSDRPSILLAIASMVVAIPLTGISTQFNGFVTMVTMIVMWVGIIVVNVVYNRSR